MSKAEPDVAMMACMTDKANLTSICKGIKNVYIANENSAIQTVVSGSADGIAELEEKLSDMGIKAVRLKVSGAFHSPYMKEASVSFRSYLDEFAFEKTAKKVYANATGEKYTKQIAALLEKQLLQPVLFRTSVEQAYADGSRIFVEVGNGKVLTNLLKDCLAGKDYTAVALCPEKDKNSAEQLEFDMAQLAVLGIAIKDDPYRAPYNGDLIPKKSKTTYTVQMKSFVLPKHREAMDAALLPDQRIIDIMKKAQEPETIIKEVEVVKEVVKPMEIKNPVPSAGIHSVNAEVFSKFMDVQTNQMQAANDMLSKVGTESEKQNVLNCVTLFQNNSMRALEAYFGNSTEVSITAPVVPVPTKPIVNIAPAAIPVPAEASAPVAMVSAPVEVAVPKAEAPVVETPKDVPVSTLAKTDIDMYAVITEAIADKTGYPTDMIDEDMELEADLGIDSIKRVEILSMINNSLGSKFTKENVEELSGISKISDMVDYLNSISDFVSVAQEAPAVESAPVGVEVAVDTPAVSNDKLKEVILSAIADKTGYPEDMIDNDMELEADLGIDSIKRVEIFSDVVKKLEIALTPDQTEELSTMSTVEDIATYLSKIV